jgi:hypothetical protein
MDVYAPLFNNIYYENTLTFLLMEYYNCYKSQKDLLSMIPADYTTRDKTVDQLLYCTEYNKRLILKEIVNLILYNENFKMTLRVSALMESNINKTSSLGPHPQVEFIGGGGNIYLFAVFFFSFMSLYRVLAEEPKNLSTTIYNGQSSTGYGNTAIQFMNGQLPPTLKGFKESIQPIQSFVEYDPNEPQHVNEFTRQYGITPIRENKQLNRSKIKEYIQEYVAPYALDLSFPNKTQQFNKYLKAQVLNINTLIKLLFEQIDLACETVTGIAQKDIIPIEIYKIIKIKVTDKVENIAEPLLDTQQTYISDRATNMSVDELRSQGILRPPNVPLTTRTVETVKTGVNMFNSLLNMARKSNSTDTNANYTNANYTNAIEQEEQYENALAKKYEENFNVLTKEAEQNIVYETWQNVTEDLNTYFGQQQTVENRQRYFGTVCNKWFGISPILNYDSENGVMSISNSAESFSSFDIILRNIEENAPLMPASPGYEDQREILMQKAKTLRGFINRYNVKIFNVMNVNNYFPTIEAFTAEVRGTVSNLTTEVAFINDNLLPIDQENVNKQIKMEAQANALALQQKRAQHDIGLNISRENQQMSNEQWAAFQNISGDYMRNVADTAGVLAKEVVGSPFFDLGNFLITGAKGWVYNLADVFKIILFWGGGGAVTVLSLYFLSRSVFRFIGANIDRSTKRIENESYNISTNANVPYNFRPVVRNATPKKPSRWDQPLTPSQPPSLTNYPIDSLKRMGMFPPSGGKKTRKNKNKKKTRKLKRSKRRRLTKRRLHP